MGFKRNIPAALAQAFSFLACVHSVCTATEPAAVPPAAEAGPVLQLSLQSVLQERRIEHFLTLRFEGDHALAQRRAMDSDLDGLISLEESTLWLAAFEKRLPNALQLRLDGAALPLVPLEAAELDLDEVLEVSPHRIELRFGVFSGLSGSSRRQPGHLVLQEGLFPSLDTLAIWEVRQPRQGALALVGQVSEALPGTTARGARREVALSLTGLGRERVREGPRPQRAPAPAVEEKAEDFQEVLLNPPLPRPGKPVYDVRSTEGQ